MEYPKYKREEKLSAKLSDEDVLECKRLRLSGLSFDKIAKIYKVDKVTVNVACKTDEQKKDYYKRMYIRQKGKYFRDMITAMKKCKKRKLEIVGEITFKKWFNEYVKTKDYKLTREKWYKNHPNYKKEYYYKNRKILLQKVREKYARTRPPMPL